MARTGAAKELSSEPAPLWADPQGPLVYLPKHYIRVKEYLEAIVASTSDAICTTDMRGRVIFFNPGAEKMLGVKASAVVGLPVNHLYEGGIDEARKIMRLLMERGNIANYEIVASVGGRKVPISMSAALLKDKDGRLVGTLGIAKDVTERVELERRLLELSVSDALTGLFNQRHFQEKIASEMQRAKRQRARLTMLLMDLDRFKEVNDHEGHLEGDAVLRRMGDAVRRSIRSGVDLGFRYGGDEFIAILPGLGPRKAEFVARRIRENFAVAQSGHPVTFSCGVAAMRSDDTPESLMRRADALMYEAKRRGRSGF